MRRRAACPEAPAAEGRISGRLGLPRQRRRVSSGQPLRSLRADSERQPRAAAW